MDKTTEKMLTKVFAGVLVVLILGVSSLVVMAVLKDDTAVKPAIIERSVQQPVAASSVVLDDDSDGDEETGDDETEEKISSAGAQVSEEEAQAIALREIGGRVSDMDTDRIRGRDAWEVEITKGSRQADVLVDMETGAVLDIEWEEDDD